MQAVGEATLHLRKGSTRSWPSGWQLIYHVLPPDNDVEEGVTMAHSASCLRSGFDGMDFLPGSARLKGSICVSSRVRRPFSSVACRRACCYCDDIFERVRVRLRNFEKVDPCDAHSGSSGQLRAYQMEGLGWLHFLRDFRFGGCLADDSGLGKTVQVPALLESRRELREKIEAPEVSSARISANQALVTGKAWNSHSQN